MANDIEVQGGKVEFDEDGTRRKVGYTFYRGDNTNFYPSIATQRRKTSIPKFVMHGWTPPEPFIDETTKVVAFGSCFAANISKYLNSLGFNVLTSKDKTAYISKMGDGFVHTDAILGQFRWAWENKQPQENLWHGYKAEEFGFREPVRLRTKALFDAADIFIITLGLSEIWYDTETGEVFWRAVPHEKYDASRHKFRIASFAETYGNIAEIHALIRKHRPDARILFTVSPIPLGATFRPISGITASEASKAILKAALDEFYRNTTESDDRLHYFPSYEICKTLFTNPFVADGRHVFPYILDVNMMVFERYYCKTGKTDEDIATIYGRALERDRFVAEHGDKMVHTWMAEDAAARGMAGPEAAADDAD